MRTAIKLAGLMILGLGLAIAVRGQENPTLWDSIKNPATRAQLKSFVAAKEVQANAATNVPNAIPPPDLPTFFAAANKGDWRTLTNYFGTHHRGRSDEWDWHGTQWEAVREIWGAFNAFGEGNEKYSTLFGNEIIRSIPPGSIYFGGTAQGRYIVTAMQKSQIRGDPFFTLTQNALADGTYLEYLRSMYGKEIYIPTAEDSQRCFDEFYSDIKKRFKDNQLKPGEEVTTSSNGAMQVSGLVSVNEIDALMIRVILDKETSREFYVEEDYPMDWIYPYLEPHGLIFKLNHKPLAQIPDKAVQQDHNYWVKIISPMIGDWLNDNTTVADEATFAEKVFLRHDFSGFKGDSNFVENAYTHWAFAKERVSIADLYALRAKHTADSIEKQRMDREADFAFRQAWVLCPNSEEVLFRYVQFLMDTHRIDDAILITKTCLKLRPDGDSVSDLLKNLEKYKKQTEERAQYSNSVAAMEDEARLHPLNYTNIFWLADSYLQMQQTNRATELLLKTISRPNVPARDLRSAAQIFAQLDDYPNLKTTLKKMTIAEPGVPEVWYDLARLDAILKDNDEAIKCLRTAIDLSDQRLKTNSEASDIRNAARKNTSDFNSISNSPDFRKLVSP